MNPRKELRMHHCIIKYKLLNEVEREIIDKLNFVLDEKHKLTQKYWKLTKNDLGLVIQQQNFSKKKSNQ